MVEINEAEGKKKKRIKRNEDNRRDLWNNVKRRNKREELYKNIIENEE